MSVTRLTSALGLLAVGLILSFQVNARTNAGEVITLSGNVTASAPGADIRSLQVRSPVFEGDTIATAPNSDVKMRFSDGGYVYLRPNSRFLIERYQNAENADEDRGFFSLLRGGLRMITGLIGKRNTENQRIKTPVATIGIRGTDFEARLCLSATDCADLNPLGLAPPEPGLYAGTFDGAILINQLQFLVGQYGFTSLRNFQTVRLPGRPRILEIDNMPDPSSPEATGPRGDSSAAAQQGNQSGDGFFIPAKDLGEQLVNCGT